MLTKDARSERVKALEVSTGSRALELGGRWDERESGRRTADVEHDDRDGGISNVGRDQRSETFLNERK